MVRPQVEAFTIEPSAPAFRMESVALPSIFALERIEDFHFVHGPHRITMYVELLNAAVSDAMNRARPLNHNRRVIEYLRRHADRGDVSGLDLERRPANSR